MVIAKLSTDNGELMLIGLSQGNIHRLMKGEPIHITKKTHGSGAPEGFDIGIIYGETEAEVLELLKQTGKITEDTKIEIDPRLKKDIK